MRKETEGCRLWLDLSSFFSCFRKQSCIYIDHSKEETVADVEKHVSKVMGLHNQRFCFLHDGWLLLDSESSRVFRDDDIVSVVPFQESISRNGTNSREDDSCVLVKIKKRKQDCEENETNVNSPEKESNTRKYKVQKKNPEINERIFLPSFPLTEKERVETTSSESEDEDTKIAGSECSSDQTRSVTESLPVVSARVKDNTDLKNEGPLKKQKRRRVRKRKKTQVCPQSENVVKESPYLLHKKLQGVSHLLNSFSAEKKQHVFFTDDTVETTSLPEITSRIQTNSEVVFNTFPTTSYNGMCTASAESPTGELSKLMSLVDGQRTPVFERKKIGTPFKVRDSNGKISQEPNQQPVFIKEIPMKDSIIKFKVLKMVNYCPEVSREITAKVVSSDLSTSQLCLLVIDGLQELQAEKGKFSLDDQADDETETAHTNDPHVSLNWNEILDPQKLNI